MHVSVTSVAILLVVLLLSMSIHEMMHAFAANWLGDDTARLQGRLTLNPLPHIDPIFTVALPLILLLSGSPYLFGAAKPVQVNFSRLRYGELGGAIVGMVGPVTNLVIAAVAALIFNHVGLLGSTAYDIFRITIVLNVGLFLFNSIPWPPLDGSRLLYAFAPEPLQDFMIRIERLGAISILILFFIVYPLVQGPLARIFISVVHFLAPSLIV
ncbi:MAG TPA: site-2 protease family protein [Candidatus Saccharimonadales bacterium]|nr:site-2 protease family protein [Candidatus Saccharimonadales bacterium]